MSALMAAADKWHHEQMVLMFGIPSERVAMRQLIEDREYDRLMARAVADAKHVTFVTVLLICATSFGLFASGLGALLEWMGVWP